MANAAHVPPGSCQGCRGPGARTRSASASPTACRKSSSTRTASRRLSRTDLHGRRRAGPGETFWQFRQFQASDTLRQIDWRRSASSDHLYVREREWEAAHTVWLWPDLSQSMNFRSHLAPTTKRDRAVLLMLAAAELLVRGGERVAMLGADATDRQPQGDDAHRRSDPRPCRRARAEQRHASRRRCTSLASRAPSCSAISSTPSPRHASTSKRLAADGAARPSDRDPRSGRRNAALRGPHRISQPGRRRTLGRRPRAEPARAIPGAPRGASRRTDRADQAPRLVVPRASHRPLAGRAAADAHHAACRAAAATIAGKARNSAATGTEARHELRRASVPQPLAARGAGNAAHHLLAAAHRSAAARTRSRSRRRASSSGSRTRKRRRPLRLGG